MIRDWKRDPENDPWARHRKPLNGSKYARWILIGIIWVVAFMLGWAIGGA